MRYLRIITLIVFVLCTSVMYVSPAATPTIGSEISQNRPTIYNLTLTSANTEYSQTMTNIRNLTFQCRTAYDIRYATGTGIVATPVAPYMTLKSGDVFCQYNLNISSMTVYFGSSQAGVVVEIEKW